VNQWVFIYYYLLIIIFKKIYYSITIERPKRDLTINHNLFLIPVKKKKPSFYDLITLAIMNRNLAKLTQNSYFSYDFFFFKKQGIM